ncbi:MAG: phage integrase N-terminal SAM-like domain-containing protein [Caldilineaceae bacterium]|nr:phage integrase N-terminal SAM-like domain-containing protein [Caldilineaceae bacterium]
MKLSQTIELGFSPNTVRNYRWAYRILIEFLGDVEIETVTSDDIRRFLKHLATKRKLSKRSVHDFWVPLSSLWTWAESELGIPHIIRGWVSQPKFTGKVVTPFTQEEIKRLIDAVEHTGQWTTRGGRRIRSKRPTAQREPESNQCSHDCQIVATGKREILDMLTILRCVFLLDGRMGNVSTAYIVYRCGGANPSGDWKVGSSRPLRPLGAEVLVIRAH